jgi:hypothetical protein
MEPNNKRNKLVMITGVQPKALLTQNEDGNLEISKNQAELLGLVDDKLNWRLVREGDGLNKKSKAIMWLEWNQDGTFNSKHDEPAVGRSLLMSPFNHAFTWQTTIITELIEVKDDYIKFKTENSTYELFEL